MDTFSLDERIDLGELVMRKMASTEGWLTQNELMLACLCSSPIVSFSYMTVSYIPG